MNKRIWGIIAVLALVAVCFLSTIGLLAWGIVFDRGPFSAESRARVALRLQGETRVLLEADVPSGIYIPRDTMQVEQTIISDRLNTLGVTNIITIQDERHLLVEIPGNVTPDQAMLAATTPGLLEFVDLGDEPLTEGTVIRTTGRTGANWCSGQVAGSSLALPLPTPTPGDEAIYHTVMTGDCLSSASITFNQANQPMIAFTLNSRGTQILAAHTSTHIGKYLAIAIDGHIISSPVIQSAITAGSGVIQGDFTIAAANGLATQLRYGALPFPVKVVR